MIGPYHAKASKQSSYIVLIVDTSDGSDFYDASRENLLYSAVSPRAEVKKAAIDCRFEKGTSWGNGCTGEIVITNNSQNAINGWKVEFIYEGQINDVWNGVLESYQGNKYIVCDAGYNAIIQPGCSVRIGVNLTYTGSNIEPADFTFIGR